MRKLINNYDFKARSKNQLIAIICHLEMKEVDTKSIDVDDWKLVTVRMSITHTLIDGEMRVAKKVVVPVYKGEGSYISLNLNPDNLENCDSFERFIDICNINPV